MKIKKLDLFHLIEKINWKYSLPSQNVNYEGFEAKIEQEGAQLYNYHSDILELETRMKDLKTRVTVESETNERQSRKYPLYVDEITELQTLNEKANIELQMLRQSIVSVQNTERRKLRKDISMREIHVLEQKIDALKEDLMKDF